MKSLLLISVVLGLLASGCRTEGWGGIAVGNHDLDEGPAVGFEPEGRGESYTVSVGEETITVVQRNLIATGPTETVMVPYTRNGNTLQFRATFSDGTEVDGILIFDDAGELIGVTFWVDGVRVDRPIGTLNPPTEDKESPPDDDDLEDDGDPEDEPAATNLEEVPTLTGEILADAVCSQFEVCNFIESPNSCRETLREEATLGAADDPTIAELDDLVALGAYQVNGPALEDCTARLTSIACGHFRSSIGNDFDHYDLTGDFWGDVGDPCLLVYFSPADDLHEGVTDTAIDHGVELTTNGPAGGPAGVGGLGANLSRSQGNL